jgi:Tryptophan halogenase
MAASMLVRALPDRSCAITVVETPNIATVGVGEATIPPLIDLLRFLGINEADFVRHTLSTYKLGLRFTGWRQIGHSYWHPFGTFGAHINLRPFWMFCRVSTSCWSISGMGVTPQPYDPLMDVVGDAQLRDILGKLAQSTAAVVVAAPLHDSYFSATASESTP